MQTTTQTHSPLEQLENLFHSVGINFTAPGHTLLPHPENTFFFVQSCILERFPEADTEAIEEAFEKFQYYERHHPKDFPEKMQLVTSMRPHWEAEETADKALVNVLSRFWTKKVEEEYRAWFKKKYPKEFKEAFATPATDKAAPRQATDLSQKKKKWMEQTPDKFLERRFPKWAYGRLYRLAQINNYHDTGLTEYWVVRLAQEEFARKAHVSLRTVSRFFITCKRHGICLKVFKEDPPWENVKKKLGPKKGHCALWVFAKSMGQAQRVFRRWRSERPRLQKQLSRLRPDKTLEATPDQDTPENHGESK